MTYRQITSEQSYMLSALRMQGLCASQIADHLGCHRSTIGRELKRNSSASDGRYRASKAQEMANGRRSRSRRNQQFTTLDFEPIEDGTNLTVTIQMVSFVGPDMIHSYESGNKSALKNLALHLSNIPSA